MIIEITNYKLAAGYSHQQLLEASKVFDSNFCSRCKGLISRHFVKTDDGYMDIFKWQTQADVDYVASTFMKDEDAIAFSKFLDPRSMSMNTYELLDVYR